MGKTGAGRSRCLAGVALSLGLFAIADAALANHGPGTSGGGSATASGETLKQGAFDLGLRQDYTRFEHIDAPGAEFALRAGEFDSLRSAYILSGSIAYGVTDDVQLSAQLGYYWGREFIDAESEDGLVAESSSANPEGLTDLNLGVKWRVMQGKPGNLALIGGLIVPTGRDDVLLSNAEPLEPSSQPGTGAWAYQFGVAYSRFLTSRVTMDASAIYTLRTPHDGFEVGDRLDLGVAVAYRINESVKTFPNYSVFLEGNAVWIGKDQSSEEGENPNSGGWTVYLSPGARVRFNEHAALTIAPSFPILQELNGDQVESRFKLAATVSLSF